MNIIDQDNPESKQSRHVKKHDIVLLPRIPREVRDRAKKACRRKLQTLTHYLVQALEEKMKSD